MVASGGSRRKDLEPTGPGSEMKRRWTRRDELKLTGLFLALGLKEWGEHERASLILWLLKRRGGSRGHSETEGTHILDIFTKAFMAGI